MDTKHWATIREDSLATLRLINEFLILKTECCECGNGCTPHGTCEFCNYLREPTHSTYDEKIHELMMKIAHFSVVAGADVPLPPSSLHSPPAGGSASREDNLADES